MSYQRKILAILAFVLLAIVPRGAQALTVTVTAVVGTSTLTDTRTNLTNGSRNPATPTSGVSQTTIVNLDGLVVNGFTFTATLAIDPTTGATLLPRVVAEQASAGSLRVNFDNTTITAPNSCAAPCKIAITVNAGYAGTTADDQLDFPTLALPGGYLTNSILGGYFVGNNPGGIGLAPDGDTASLTDSVVSGGAKTNCGSTPTITCTKKAVDPVNYQSGTTDPAPSLPWSCAGTAGCIFTATFVDNSFTNSTDMTGSETIQHKCPTTSACRRGWRKVVTVTFLTPGDKVTLNTGGGSAPTTSELFTVGLPSIMDIFSGSAVIKLGPRAKDDSANVKVDFRLGSTSNGIQCLVEPVFIRLGTGLNTGTVFQTTIAPGVLKKSKTGACVGDIDTLGGELHVVINHNAGGADFNLNMTLEDSELASIVNPIFFKLTIGDDTGNRQISPVFH